MTVAARGFAAALVLPFAAALVTAHTPQGTGQARLRAEIDRFARAGGGTVGVSALHLESGEAISVNGDEPFPMASTFKVPIAVRLFQRVDAGEVDLATMITLTERDIHPGSGEISQLLDDPGVSLSVLNLTELMLLISDNSATDLVLRAAGGAEAVNGRLRELGITDIRVDRPTIRLIADWSGVDLPPGIPGSRARGAPGRQRGVRRRPQGHGHARRHDGPAPGDLERRRPQRGEHGAAARHHAALHDRRGSDQGSSAARDRRHAQDGVDRRHGQRRRHHHAAE
jgi:beta-lactamase class A